MISDRTMGIFMYFNLQKQAFEWLSAVENMPNKYMANKLLEAKKANEKLIAGLELQLAKYDPENVEKFWTDSEYFSKVLETIRMAESNESKNDLILIMRAYIDGKIKIEDVKN